MRGALAASLLLLGCSRAPAPSPRAATDAAPVTAPAPTPDAAPIPDAAMAEVDDEVCADCHPDVVEAWTRSPMGASAGAIEALADLPARVAHPVTGQAVEGSAQDERALRVSHGGRTETAHRFIGSGSHTRSYIFERSGRHFVMPLTWYRAKAGWDLSPGYHVAEHPGFDRALRADCAWCHGDPAPLVEGAVDRFTGPLEPIGCARCHGSGAAHAAARGEGRDAPIVVPTKLAPELEAAVCEYCHLQGTVRLLRPGKDWSDFRPGTKLEEVVAVFVRQQPDRGVGIASHGERLRRSRCAPAGGGRLTCTTCHAPHRADPADRSAACRDCHGEGHAPTCGGPAGLDCAKCHMVNTATDDIPHVAITDHFIRARPTPAATVNAAEPGPLVWVADPQVAPSDRGHQRLLGRAYTEAWRAHGAPADLQAAARWLEQVKPADRDGAYDLATVRQARGHIAGALEALSPHLEGAGPDWRVPLALSQLRLQSGDAKGALAAADLGLAHIAHAPLEVARSLALTMLGRLDEAEAAAARALALRADSAEAWNAAGVRATVARDPRAALAAFEKVAALQPHRVLPHLNTAQALSALGRHVEALAAADTALARAKHPRQTQTARAARAAALLDLGRRDEAARAIGAAMASPPPPPAAWAVLGRLALATGKSTEALELLERAVEATPLDAAAWAALAEAAQKTGDGALAERARRRAVQLAPPPSSRP